MRKERRPLYIVKHCDRAVIVACYELILLCLEPATARHLLGLGSLRIGGLGWQCELFIGWFLLA